MNTQTTDENVELSPNYQSILLATDSSDHSNRAITEAVAAALLYNTKLTGIHIYAAKLHDVRFRQMEGGLPEPFRQEQELERQRIVHDDLITRGLSIITDSYLDQVEKACEQASIPFTRCALEGKNYRQLVNEANSGNYELLIMGAKGLGAIAGSRLGTVCERVVRRTAIDTLIIKEPQRSLAEGPLLVAVDLILIITMSPLIALPTFSQKKPEKSSNSNNKNNCTKRLLTQDWLRFIKGISKWPRMLPPSTIQK